MTHTTPDTVEISLGWTKRLVPCFRRYGQLAVTPDQTFFSKKYVVTHLPSGYYIDPPIGNLRAAKRFCAELAKLHEWTSIHPEKVKRYWKLRRRIKRLRSKMKLPKVGHAGR